MQSLPTLRLARQRIRSRCVLPILLGFLCVPRGHAQLLRQIPLVARRAESQVSSPGIDTDTRRGYAGDSACNSCHQDKVQSFHRTAHYLTSQLPSKDSIFGDFSPNANVLKTSNPELYFRMDATKEGFFETAVEGAPPNTTSRRERIDLVIGSGGKGQSYAYWRGNQLFQLPISFWTRLGWVNSPGYRDGVARFDRPIIPRCLECHTTYFEALPPPPNTYTTSGFLVGITCEKCHGPGQAHIRQLAKQSPAPSDPAILNPAKFSRERQMDLCAWCHAGHGSEIEPWFSYVPGQPLQKYIDFPRPDPKAQIDVHGSQVELLKKSRCFESSRMTCLTCHDVHQSQHDLAAFSQKCLGCHKVQSCGVFAKQGNEIANDCIDCHMPKQETNLIVFDTMGRSAEPEVRNHWIKIYR